MHARFGVRLKWFEGPGGKTASLYLEIAPQSATSDIWFAVLGSIATMATAAFAAFRDDLRRCCKWLGLVPLPRSSKMPTCQQRFEISSGGPVVVYLFIELSLDCVKQPSRPVLSHVQKRVVKDTILIFGSIERNLGIERRASRSGGLYGSCPGNRPTAVATADAPRD
jgi:hypothetical protein